jgi:hypothetical protein
MACSGNGGGGSQPAGAVALAPAGGISNGIAASRFAVSPAIQQAYTERLMLQQQYLQQQAMHQAIDIAKLLRDARRAPTRLS